MADETSISSEKQLIVFTLADEEFGFDINDVREIIKMVDITQVPDIDSVFKGIINLRGGIIAVMDLAKKLNLSTKDADKDTRIIVAEIGENAVGLLVDGVQEVLRITQDMVHEAPIAIASKVHEDYLDGVAIIDKRLVILLDIKNLIGVKGAEQLKQFDKKKIKQ